MMYPAFFRSIRARLLFIALLLLTIPLIGFRFIQEMDGYLRAGQQQVLVSAARMLAATLSDRPQLFRMDAAENAAEEAERRRLLATFSSADPEAAADLGSAYLPSEEVERTLAVVADSAARIWVVDSRSRVRGLSGSLNTAATSRGVASAQPEGNWGTKLYGAVLRPLVRVLSADPASKAGENPAEARRAVMSQVDRALVGEPNTHWRAGVAGSNTVLSVAQPIWQGDNIVGAVVLEESTASGQSLKTAALESLLATTLVVFGVGFVALLGFAWRLAYRVRRLQTEAERAIDVHGRIRGDIAGTGAGDEIGALSRTLNGTLQRLRRYNEYLERMAARLSHELRTPVAVVRSSLDNLRLGPLPAAERVYVDRADEGLRRLSALIARMSEATQLESMLQNAEIERFDLARVISGCVDGYRLAYPERAFACEGGTAAPVWIAGNADAIAQMLDKLVQNAVEFARADTSIRIVLGVSAGMAQVAVENEGPPLPAGVSTHLFVSMVSARADTGAPSGHLGLGLYIVRLIAEFHGGMVKAENTRDGRGVRFTVSLPTVAA